MVRGELPVSVALRNQRSSCRVPSSITSTANGLDEVRRAELATQRLDVHIDGTHQDHCPIPDGGFDQFLTTEGPARVPDKVFQQAKLGRSELKFVVSTKGSMPDGIDSNTEMINCRIDRTSGVNTGEWGARLIHVGDLNPMGKQWLTIISEAIADGLGEIMVKVCSARKVPDAGCRTRTRSDSELARRDLGAGPISPGHSCGAEVMRHQHKETRGVDNSPKRMADGRASRIRLHCRPERLD